MCSILVEAIHGETIRGTYVFVASGSEFVSPAVLSLKRFAIEGLGSVQ